MEDFLSLILSLIIMLLIVLASGIVCAKMAGKKGRSKGLWFALGILAPFIALMLIALTPARSDQEQAYVAPNAHNNAPVCPSCHQPVPANANQCPHCLQVLQDTSQFQQAVVPSSSVSPLGSEDELNQHQSSRRRWNKN